MLTCAYTLAGYVSALFVVCDDLNSRLIFEIPRPAVDNKEREREVPA